MSDPTTTPLQAAARRSRDRAGIASPAGLGDPSSAPSEAGAQEADCPSYVLWLCDRCGDHAEVEPGGVCEVCCEGTIRVVEVVPRATYVIQRDALTERVRVLEEALRRACDTAEDWIHAEGEADETKDAALREVAGLRKALSGGGE